MELYYLYPFDISWFTSCNSSNEIINSCDPSGSQHARVVDESQLRFFRLAVQQAEAGTWADATWNASACSKDEDTLYQYIIDYI